MGLLVDEGRADCFTGNRQGKLRDFAAQARHGLLPFIFDFLLRLDLHGLDIGAGVGHDLLLALAGTLFGLADNILRLAAGLRDNFFVLARAVGGFGTGFFRRATIRRMNINNKKLTI
jgi:hypothetical protein